MKVLKLNAPSTLSSHIFWILNSWKLLRFLTFILTREEKMQAAQNYLQ